MGKIERIEVPASDRSRLEGLVRDRNTPQKVVWRARIVLLTGDGLRAVAVAGAVGKSVLTVRRWRRRYRDKGVEGLLKDATRPPRRKPLSAETVKKVVDVTLNTKPPGATHWSVRTMAKASGISPSAVQRIWKAHGSLKICPPFCARPHAEHRHLQNRRNAMPKFTVEATYRMPYYRQRTYDAATSAEACRLAIEDDDWESELPDYECPGPTYITGIWKGTDTAYDGEEIAVPLHFQEIALRMVDHFHELLDQLAYVAQPQGLSRADFERWLPKATAAIEKARSIVEQRPDPVLIPELPDHSR